MTRSGTDRIRQMGDRALAGPEPPHRLLLAMGPMTYALSWKVLQWDLLYLLEPISLWLCPRKLLTQAGLTKEPPAIFNFLRPNER